MDSNTAATAKLLAPPQQCDDDELPAPGPDGRGNLQRTLTGTYLRVMAAIALFSDYCTIVGRSLSDMSQTAIRVHDDAAADKLVRRLWWRVPALLALAYAVVAALTWIIGRLEQRQRRRLRLRLQPGADDRDDARWERRLKVAAQMLAHAMIGVLVAKSTSMIPCAFFIFMWVKSGDKVYINVHKKEESDDEEKQYEARDVFCE